MSFPALNGLRIGCVPYLNARPLVWGIEDHVTFEVPSLLADHFAAGIYDVALIPVFEAFRIPGVAMVDGTSISCLGDVRSVILAYREPFDEIAEIVLDPSSRTSANLLRVLLSDRFHLSPQLVSTSGNPNAARLIIGDPALAFQDEHPPGWQILDLGRAWHEWTGLPFVFAAWTLREGISPQAAVAFREVAADGLAHRKEIASREADPHAAFDYLAHNIRYGLAIPEKQALARFRHLLEKNGLLAPGGQPTQFV